MDQLNYLVNWVAKDVFGVPAYLVGIMTLVALIASRKSVGEIIGGTLKAILGFIILGIGAGAVIGALNPLGALVTGAFNVNGVVPTNEAITAIANNIPAVAQNVAFAMFLGVIGSLVIARITPLRYVFLTGHHMLFMATVLTVVLYNAKVDSAVQVLVAAFGLATMMVVMPAFSMPWMKRVTGGERVAMGHFGTFGYIAAGVTGQVVGRGSKSTEEMEFPQSLRFLRDPMVGTAVAMIFIYLVLAVIFLLRAGEGGALDAVTKAMGTPAAGSGAGGTLGFLTLMFNNALVFGGGVAVILLGVRTILGEIVPAFAGIAERVIPGAVPALDCPVSFPYAPNAVLVGFLSSVAGGLVGFGLLWATNNMSPALAVTLILPGMIPHFFTGGTAGVFGNATGGRRGAVGGGFVNGLIITVFAAILVPVMGAIGFQGTTFGDADFQWFGFVVGNVARVTGIAAAVGVVAVCVVLLAFASWWQHRYVDSGWVPGGRREPTAATPEPAPAGM
ncbi:MAG TPA: PTS ascorbate transporter subunit IIC [Candidatus Limnocylindrales bacterium]|nr:PTS ascorbate transporter subunit IIC [Candidatus Limnocylindrales bacterium]